MYNTPNLQTYNNIERWLLPITYKKKNIYILYSYSGFTFLYLSFINVLE